MKVNKKLQAVAMLALLLPILAACGGTAANTPAPTVVNTPATASTPTAGMTPTEAMMMASPTAGSMMTGTMMVGTETPGMMMTGTPMMMETGTPGTMMTGTAMMGTTPTAAGPTAVPATPTPAQVGEAGANATKITFWHTQTRKNADVLNGMVADFNKTHPDVFVQPEYKGGYTDLLKAAQAAAAGGDLPDLTVGYENWIPGLIKADAVVPMDDYINDPTNGLTAADLADIFPQFIETNKYPAYGNKMYSFPFTKSTLTMWVNMDLLKKIGKSAAPQTWAEFVEDSKAIRALGPDYYGFEYDNEPSRFVAMLYANGGKMMNDDNSQFVFNSPEGVSLMQMLADGTKGGYFLLTDPGKFQDEQDFAKQKVAFVMDSSTASSFIPSYFPTNSEKTPLPESKFDWTAATPPHADGMKPVATLYGGNIIMYKTTDARQKAAWQFIKWFTQKEQTAKWASVSGYQPLRKSAADSPDLKAAYDKNPQAKSVFDNVLPNAIIGEPKVGSYQQVRDLIADMVTSVAKGAKTPADALKETQDKANDTLK